MKMKNLRESVLLKMPEICKEEGVDSRIFDPRADPSDSEEMKKIKKEIRKRYLDLLSRIPFHIVKDFYNHNHGYPRKKVDEVKRVIEISFEGAFRNLLKEIKDRYPKILEKGEKDGSRR